MNPPVFVTKASGKKEEFSSEKLLRSIRRAGIPTPLETKVMAHVNSVLYPDIPTSEVYKHITEFLTESHLPTSSKYSLKHSLMELGPSGYPFEKYIAAVLAGHGYGCQTNVIVQGKCVSHEIDVVATKDSQHNMLECKYHNRPGTRTDVKIALYIKSRFDDVRTQYPFREGWLVTNTKCTTDAISYAQCEGIKIVSWGFPLHGNLQDLIETSGLYPLTCQTSLSESQKQSLLSKDIVLCRDLLTLDQQTVRDLRLSPSDHDKIKEEVTSVLGSL